MNDSPLPPSAKILNRAELLQRLGRPRAQRLVFTNGCFDILHRGHVEYLFAARALGDLLVVGLNTDASTRALKGEGRPVNRELDRAFVLAGLACVDAVTLFDEATPAALIEALVPDVLVKGGITLPKTSWDGTWWRPRAAASSSFPSCTATPPPA